MQEEEEETMNFASQTIQLHLWTHVRVLAMTIFMLPLQWDTLSTHPLTEQVNDVLAGQINASGNGNDYADKNGGGGVRGCDRLMAHTIKSSGCQPSNEDSMQTMALPSWANCWLDDEDYVCWRKHVVIVCRGGGRRHHNVLEVTTFRWHNSWICSHSEMLLLILLCSLFRKFPSPDIATQISFSDCTETKYLRWGIIWITYGEVLTKKGNWLQFILQSQTKDMS